LQQVAALDDLDADGPAQHAGTIHQHDDLSSLSSVNFAYNWHRPHVSIGRMPPITKLGLTRDNLLRLHI
jgi:hypothetical protein